GRAGLSLDGGPGREGRARVLRVFWRHARGDRLNALETGGGVERGALDAAVQIDAAPRTPGVGFDRDREPIAAAGAAKDLVRRHEVGCPRSFCLLQRPARSPRFGSRLRNRFGAFGFAVARIVLITALSILSIAHSEPTLHSLRATPPDSSPTPPAANACRGRAHARPAA